MKVPFYRNICGGGRRERAEERAEADACKRYYAQLYGHGRSAVARALDYIVLRGVLYAGAYLYFAPLFASRGTAMLLSGIALAMMMLLLRIWREIVFAKFVQKETARLKELLLRDKLLLCRKQSLTALCAGRCLQGETPVVLQRALPATADDLLAALREFDGSDALHIFSCAGYDAQAAAFAARLGGRLTLHDPKELLKLVADAGMQPSNDEVRRYIVSAQRRRKEERRKRRQASTPFQRAYAMRYAFIALLLVGASFLSRYTLYYRMLAGLCVSIAACGAVMTQKSDAPRTREPS